MQYATRAQGRMPAELAGTGPAINVTNVAQFGGPIAGLTDAGFGFTQDVFQVNNSLTYLRGDHSFKGGFDIQHVADTRTSTPFQLYTFATTAAYQAALSGAAPFGYQTFQQYFGEPDLGVLVEPLRLLPAGRLAAERLAQGALRPALRPLRRAGAQRQRAVRDLARLRRRQEQLGAAARRGVDAWAGTAARWCAPTPA